MAKLQELEEELKSLPKGTIAWKKTSKTSDAKKPYLQWRVGSKVKTKYIHPEELERITKQIQRRKELQKQLRSLNDENRLSLFQMNVIYGQS